jgi:hypothetical protein
MADDSAARVEMALRSAFAAHVASQRQTLQHLFHRHRILFCQDSRLLQSGRFREWGWLVLLAPAAFALRFLRF